MQIEFSGTYSVSSAETTAGLFILLSRTSGDQIHLLSAKNIEIVGRPGAHLRKELESAKGLLPLDGVSLRANLSSEWGALMTEHMMKVHHHLNRDSTDVVSHTAWRYSTLTSWGEASAARELSLDMKIPVTTIHNRLRLARERGILASPGAGARLGR